MTEPPSLPDRSMRELWKDVADPLREGLVLLLGAVAVAWGLEIVDTILFNTLDRFGIQPRTLGGLFGVMVSPFLHLGFGHLVSNTLPFLMLGGIVLMGGRRVFLTATLFIVAVGGMMLWMLGPSATNHVGASGLVFGYLGFLLARGIVERSIRWIVVSVIVLLVYGGMLQGVLPGEKGGSWQGHLFGFISGIFAARVIFTRKGAVRKEAISPRSSAL